MSFAQSAVIAAVLSLVDLQGQPAGLRIVVIEGEGAVNIIQQKTAVSPLVEIRDRNDVPVAGATVTFTIGTGQPAAFSGGVSALTVTTNAAGRAAASGFSALAPGTVQINVQAAFQGQVATAAIAQTNVATLTAAAQATGSAASGASGGGSTAGGAGGGAGGGISAQTIGVIGAAVGGGVLAATKIASNAGAGGDEESFDAYRGSFNSPFVFTTVGTGGPVSPSTCVFTGSLTGTITIDLRTDGSGGRAYVEGAETFQSVSGTCTLSTQPVTFTTPDTFATGGPSALTFVSFRPGVGLNTRVTFNGSHSGNTITGSLTIEITTQSTSGTTTNNGSGSATVSVTLLR